MQFSVGEELRRLNAGGQVLTKVAVRTAEGVYVADVAWVSDARWAQYPDDGPLPIAPEICVEVRSPSNSMVEMRRKARAYLEAGAEEAWIVQLDGTRETLGAWAAEEVEAKQVGVGPNLARI